MAKYKIGQLSRTMGVSSHLLKHYEKFDIVYPTKDDSSNYRYYNIAQISRLIESKKFRNIGYAIKDVSEIINGYDNKSLNKSIDNHIKTLYEERERINFQIKLAENLYGSSLECDKYLDQWFVEYVPARYVLKQSINREIIMENSSVVCGDNLIDYAPLVKTLLYIPKENLGNESLTYNWSLSIKENYVKELNLKLDNRFIKIDEHRAFITYIKIECPYTDNRKLITKIESLIEKYNFECIGDILAYVLKAVNEEDKMYQFIKIYIPIE